MSKLIETTILYLALAAFAYYGVTWGVPKVTEVLGERLTQAARAGETR